MVTNRLPGSLYHFTCVDGLAAIARDGWTLKPNVHPMLGRPAIWLTDMAQPDRAALGLISSKAVPCDRTEFRLEVLPEALALCVWWPAYARSLPRAIRQTFEYGSQMDPAGNPGRPVHWWVAWHPVAVRPYATRADGTVVASVPKVIDRRRRH